MNNRIGMIALAIALGVSVSASAGTAKFNAAGKTPVARQASARPDGKGSYQLAYAYERGFGVDRSVGVASFSSPSTGIYCIQPSKALKLDKIYPLVSIEWSTSFGESLQAFWVDTSSYTDCPAGDLEVQTWDISTGTAPVVSSNVSFDIVVP